MNEPIGYIVMCGRNKAYEEGFMAPMAYGLPGERFSDSLSRDRGATIFPSREAASDALSREKAKREAEGHPEFFKRFRFSIVSVFPEPVATAENERALAVQPASPSETEQDK